MLVIKLWLVIINILGMWWTVSYQSINLHTVNWYWPQVIQIDWTDIRTDWLVWLSACKLIDWLSDFFYLSDWLIHWLKVARKQWHDFDWNDSFKRTKLYLKNNSKHNLPNMLLRFETFLTLFKRSSSNIILFQKIKRWLPDLSKVVKSWHLKISCLYFIPWWRHQPKLVAYRLCLFYVCLTVIDCYYFAFTVGVKCVLVVFCGGVLRLF